MSECAFPVWGITIIGLFDNKGACNPMQRKRKVTAFVPKFQYKIHKKEQFTFYNRQTLNLNISSELMAIKSAPLFAEYCNSLQDKDLGCWYQVTLQNGILRIEQF